MKKYIIIMAFFACIFSTESKTEPVDLGVLGVNITETITNPSGMVDDLIGNIYKYYEALETMHKAMKKKVKEAMDAFHELKSQGGPPFLKLLPVDEKPLEKFYKWERYHGIEFRGFLKYNEDQWRGMNEFVNRSAEFGWL